MSLRVNTIKISGMPGEGGWSQSYEYLADENEKSPGMSLLIVFSTIRKDVEVDDAVVGRELLNQFRKSYFTDVDRPPDVLLKEAVKQIFDDYFQKLDGLEIAAAAFVNDVLYTSCINGGKASLYRDGFLVKILDSNSPQLVSASGYPKEGDVMVLATGDLYKKMTYFDVKNSLSKGLESASEEFSMKLHNTPTAGVCLISFLKNGKDVLDNNVNNDINNKEKETSKSDKVDKFNFKYDLLRVFKKAKMSIPRKKIYLDRKRDVEEYVPSKNKKAALVGIILIILLGVSVVFGFYKNKKDKYKASYTDTLNSARESIENAIQLKDVEITSSRESLLSGINLLKSLQEQDINDPEIDRLNGLVSENEEQILGEKKVNFDLWLDLTLITDAFKSERITYYEDSLGVFDADKSTFINVVVDGKKSTTNRLPDEIKNAKMILLKSDGYYILTDDGIYQFSKKDKVIDKNWNDISFFQSYASNIYLVDKGGGEILKSAGTENGFSESKKWTTADKLDFSQSRSFAIDGYAWVLNPKHEVLKFSYGNQVKFQLTLYPYDLPDYDLLYTNENVDDLYLLDREGKRISVYSKEGEYKYDYMSDEVSNALDFVVTNDGEIILLTGEKLYASKP